jgi:pimeloyl-ACP methyl ester carboxylesterase
MNTIDALEAKLALIAGSRFGIQYRVIHGYRRAFVHAGSGPALLFIHGIGDSSDTWLDVMARLAQDYTVIAPDLLGHGRSDKPRADYSVAGYANAMRDLLTVLEIDRVTIIGHSLGGGVALQFAYQYPDRCERLVLVSSGGVSREVHPILRLAAVPAASDVTLPLLQFAITRWLVRRGLQLSQRFETDFGRDAGNLLRVVEALPDATARAAFLRTLRAAVDSRGQVITMLDRCYLTSGMPTLLMWGTRDPIIPFHHAQIAHAAMPGSRLEAFDGAGHFPHHHDPSRFVNLLRDFLATTQPSSYRGDQWRELLRRGRPSLPQVETATGVRGSRSA